MLSAAAAALAPAGARAWRATRELSAEPPLTAPSERPLQALRNSQAWAAAAPSAVVLRCGRLPRAARARARRRGRNGKKIAADAAGGTDDDADDDADAAAPDDDWPAADDSTACGGS